MASGVTIPGRRLDYGAVFYTDWIERGGDCLILRGDLLQKDGAGASSVSVSAETRSEDDPATVQTMTATQALSMTAVGSPYTGLWQADSANTATKGVRSQVRFKVSCTDGAKGEFFVVRLFAPIFFDNAKYL